MKKWWIPVLTAVAVLQGCSSVQRGNIPVVDSSTRVSNSERVQAKRTSAYPTSGGSSQVQTLPEEGGVTVMIPQGTGGAPISTGPISTGPITRARSALAPSPATPTRWPMSRSTSPR